MFCRRPTNALLCFFCCFTTVFVTASTEAQVAINEIFYNAPDDLDDLEFVELQNHDDQSVDVSGWKLRGEIKYDFPEKTKLQPGQIIVLAKDREVFQEFFEAKVFGEFKKSLSNSGGELVLRDANGNIVESLTYKDQWPWPLAADGYSASIERISVLGEASNPANWAPSKLSGNYDRLPSGSPGKKNSVAQENTPASFGSIEWTPKQLQPGQKLEVKVRLLDAESIESAILKYRYVAPGFQGEEHSADMKKIGDNYVAEIPSGTAENRLLRFRAIAKTKSGGVGFYPHPNEIRPSFTVYVAGKKQSSTIPIAQLFFIEKTDFEAGEQYRKTQSSPTNRGGFGGGFPGGRRGSGRGGGSERGFGGRGFFSESPAMPLLPQGNAAFVFTDNKTGKTDVFDFINITRRKSGWKIRLQKDRLLNGIKTINVLYESDEQTVLNEVLAYQLYELAGNKTCKHGFTRLMINGSPAGYHLYFEQPNKAFFRRNDINDDGDLYKLIWMGNARMSPRVPNEEQRIRPDITGRYEKKTNRHQGHQDLIKVVELLESAKSDDETWRIIEKHFDVEQVVNYFAVNSLISHWDGFFNNFFVYFDRERGKWSMYPWDQDSTWSQRGGRPAQLYEMPLFFGAEGATPNGIVKNPERPSGRSRRGFGGFGSQGLMWWRPGGDFSRPMLANPEFNNQFQTRLDELTTSVFTEDTFGPRIIALKKLEPEIRLRARLRKADEDAAIAEFNQNIAALHEHLSMRRAFVQEQLKKSKSSK